ncbi:MAG: hypothetical protein ACNI3A_09535 [Desulfovibrio sp.]|uniref:hypothetical protein n=1 Tax=Desulfovibrio sp. 7SRBS1 TaxID=3378064 RepID=UPI003B3D8889
MSEEQRRHERYEFESSHVFSMVVGEGTAEQEAQFFLRNLSFSGMMIEFISGYGPPGVDKGCGVAVTHAPGALEDVLVATRGIIVWNAGAVCGVCFEKQLQECTPSIRERMLTAGGGSWTD